MVLALAGCFPGGVAVPVSRLEVPPEVSFPLATRGETVSVAVPVRNPGAGSAHVVAAAEAPFAVPDAEVPVGSGSIGSVVVTFTADDYDAADGTLIIDDGHGRRTVALHATVDDDADGDGSVAVAAGGTDCDDDDPDVSPAAHEICDHIDDDCDGTVDDDAIDRVLWMHDGDSDGFGVDSTATLACDAPPDASDRGGDCDDADPTVHPGAHETWYDGVDQDCGGGSDNDADVDGYDAVGHGGLDCLDTDPDVNPGAVEIRYDGTDEDCSGDSDGDFDGDGADAVAFGGTDCDDDNPTVRPGVRERDDGVDQDCDGWVDEDFVARGVLAFTEVLRDPAATANAHGQYVEIVNLAPTRSVDLAGMTLTSAGGSVRLPTVHLSPGSVALICADADPATNGGLDCAATLPAPLGAIDGVALSGLVTFDELDWTGWIATPGVAWELAADALDPDANDEPASWCDATTAVGNGELGTPGIVDPPCP
jgi:hypothetical protein